MARFAAKKTTADDSLISDTYSAGFSYSTDKYAHISQPGLSEGVIKEISHLKEEPAWMLDFRLKAHQEFLVKPLPVWGADLSAINYDQIRYYLRPTDDSVSSWDEVPAEVKETFEKLGIPEAERSMLAGVKAQYDSEVVYGSLQNVWAKDGVIFLSMDEGLKMYPELVKEHFGKLIPYGDNKFAALNSAVWSGGSFVYVPKGVEVKMPLQAYFRINAPNAGQFERTLIIVDEGAKVHYVEGCFTAGTKILTDQGLVAIEDVTKEDKAMSHQGRYQSIYHTQVRPYSGQLYTLVVTGNPSEAIEATEEHPFLVVKRKYKNERNKKWDASWLPVKNIQKGDYVCLPIDKTEHINDEVTFEVPVGNGKHGWQLEEIKVKSDEKLFKLIGYYLAEGSISSGSYLNFSFSSEEREYIEEVKTLLKEVFGIDTFAESQHLKNNGTSVVVRSVRLCRIFEQFGTHAHGKVLPKWVLQESREKQKALISAWYYGDGNYYRRQHLGGFKEVFRISTVSQTLAQQGRLLLARLGIASSLNLRDRSQEKRQKMFTLVIGGEYMIPFGKMVGQPVQPKMWSKKRATMYYLDDNYLYAPVKSITQKRVDTIPVYNFSVTDDESYVAGGVAVHNCTAPNFSSGSLHSAVVEIFVKKGARCQYTTIQNWYKNVYNLVTKRAHVAEEGEMVWTDFNMGSKVTMKYPSFILAGKGARGETLSMALAGEGQHQDTGSKAIHLAPHTSSTIISKSISKDGGRTSYRGLVNVGPQAHHSQNTVICDALLLDGQSRSDTYPVDKIFNSHVAVQHEATVSKIGDDQLFYLMSRGVAEEEARKMIVNGFIEDLVRKLPLEYAVEMNRLIDHEMEGSIG
ncbi:MAG TPA: Fe-S cluster assembly protein SufB [Patescibacteria group bacterium]